MPVPTPRKGEHQDEFHSRCMGDPEHAKAFPDEAQRNAICYRQWDEAHPEHPHKKALLMATDFLRDTPACWHHHMGFWCVFTERFLPLFYAWQQGQPLAFGRNRALDDPVIEAVERRAYDVNQEGTAIIPLMGPLTKGGSVKFDGTSTLRTRQALRMAMRDEAVKSVLLHVDSPGGHVAGVEALAGDIALLRSRKPVLAHIDDLGASAAYWVASQADAIYANPTSEIGSIGTIAVLEDTSGRMDRLGVKVHVISTGPYKGVGVEGAPISETALEYLKERVAGINQHFLAAVQRGRRASAEQVQAWADGKVYLAETAHALGLIDGVQSLDDTLAQLVSSPGAPAGGRFRSTRAEADAMLGAAQARFSQGGGNHAHHD